MCSPSAPGGRCRCRIWNAKRGPRSGSSSCTWDASVAPAARVLQPGRPGDRRPTKKTCTMAIAARTIAARGCSEAAGRRRCHLTAPSPASPMHPMVGVVRARQAPTTSTANRAFDKNQLSEGMLGDAASGSRGTGGTCESYVPNAPVHVDHRLHVRPESTQRDDCEDGTGGRDGGGGPKDLLPVLHRHLHSQLSLLASPARPTARSPRGPLDRRSIAASLL